MPTRAALMSVLVIACAPTTASSVGGASGSSGSDDVSSCDTSTDCAVVSRTACGVCGSAQSGDAQAVRVGVRPTFESAATGCPDCAMDDDPRLVAYCGPGHTCALLDLATDPLAACTTDADCMLRPRGCCACGETRWVAVATARSDAYAQAVCPAVVTCPECVGAAPASAACREGRCVVP